MDFARATNGWIGVWALINYVHSIVHLQCNMLSIRTKFNENTLCALMCEPEPCCCRFCVIFFFFNSFHLNVTHKSSHFKAHSKRV